MKKLLAIMMALVMLLSACAFAESTDILGNAEIVLSDIVVFDGEDMLLDLSGLGVSLGLYDGENLTGIQLGLDALEQDVLDLNLALVGEQLLLGMTGVSSVYSLDISDLAEEAGVDMDDLTDLDMDEVVQQISPEDQIALAALALEAVALFEAGTTTGLTEEIDGVTYDLTTIEVTEEAIQPVLDKAVAILDNYSYLLEDEGIESFSQLYNEIAPAIGFSGTVLESGSFAVLDFTLTGSIMNGAQSGFVILYLEGNELEAGVDLGVEVIVGAGEEYYTLAFNLSVSDENDGSWVPASDAPVDLLAALEDETQSQMLMLEGLSAGMMAVSQAAAANETVAALLNSLMVE